MIVPFDQYQRYKTLSRIVESIKIQYKIDSFKILEIGANVQKNLEKFLPNDDIFYSDINLPEELINDSHCFIADATNLVNIDEDEYDIVLASDVYEHIPNDKRADFIKEINRVAKYSAVICFPFLADHNVETEKRVDQYFATIAGESYIWLKEHYENGLPSKEELNSILQKLKINYSQFEHGDVRTWELLMKNHMFTCFAQDLIIYREQMDSYYNEYVYPNDISNQNYRVFYIMYKDLKKKNIIDNIIQSLNYSVAEKAVDKCLLDFSQDIKDINELKLRLKINEEFAKNMNKYSFDETILAENAFGIYFDFGDGYSEDNKVTAQNSNCIKIENNVVKVIIPNNVNKIRIDPLEGKKCILFNFSIMTDGKNIKNYVTNAINSGRYLIFNTTDPWIEYEIASNINQIELYANIIIIDNIDINLAIDEINTLYSKLIDEIKKVQKDNEVLTCEKLDILLELEKYQNEHENIKKNNLFLTNEIERFAAEKANLQLEVEAISINNQNLQHEISNIKNHNKSLSDMIDKLNKDNLNLLYEVNSFKNMCDSISNSFFWKCTKPARVVIDVLKRILKKNRIMYKICRELLILKRNGIRGKINKQKNDNSMDIKQIFEELPQLDEIIKFSILVPIYNPDTNYLKILIESVISQNYSNWELCLADGSNNNTEEIRFICEEYAKQDARIKYIILENNKGISENTNECAKLATGDYYVLSDQDDLIHPHALYYNALAIAETDADVLYSDEDHITEDGQHINVLYKPDWSPDLLYNQMYICHLFVFRKTLFDKVKGFRKEYDGSQDYDLMLRFSEVTNRICHIPKVLYSWRETETSTALNADAKPYAHYAGKNALDNHLKRKYGSIAHAEFTENLFVYEARFDLLTMNKKVSIVIPMKDNYKLTDNCINSILSLSTYNNYEILIVNNRSSKNETYKWFEKIQKVDDRIRIINADFEFNWSKINNYAVSQSEADVYVFLNNDTLIITPDWIERLCELTLREDVGIVGPLLLYEDNTIQHAGVVVGIGGWADHIFKGMRPVHFGSPFISPMVNRNVLAVTGACMCISREKFEILGGFDEGFIICGSDVELGIRAYEMGYNNIYDAHVRLYHLESKSRDSYIPEIDFKKSYECYCQYRENGDPYYNNNLDMNSALPKESGIKMDINRIKKSLKFNRFTAPIYKKVRDIIVENSVTYEIPETFELGYRKAEIDHGDLRLNILVPSVNKEHVFGGISTALKFFEKLGEQISCDLRIIVTDSAYDEKNSVELEGYSVVEAEKDSNTKKQLLPFGDRYNKTIPVRKRDIFIATGWWTAYTIAEIIRWQNNFYQSENTLIYFIQDYEPGFYAWSSRYLMADSTYKLDIPTIAIFNSKLLKEYFSINNYKFFKEYYFEPSLNESLKNFLVTNKDKYERKNRILIYGRPSVQRNAFELIVNALKKWSIAYEKASEWEIISLGEQFKDIELFNDVKIKSYGKVSLEEYAQIMLETKIGISLMVSPHPSYPPLEMSTFGIKTITNTYSHKDLSDFNNNIVSLSDCSQTSIVNKLVQLCNNDIDNEPVLSDAYCNDTNDIKAICDDLKKFLID